MLIQTMAGVKTLMAQVTLPSVPVPGPIGASVRVLEGTLPADELLGDEPTGILGPDELVDGVAVQRGGVSATAALQVVCHTRGGGVAVGAEGTLDFLATVGSGVEVLCDVISISPSLEFDLMDFGCRPLEDLLGWSVVIYIPA